jgi:integrase
METKQGIELRPSLAETAKDLGFWTFVSSKCKASGTYSTYLGALHDFSKFTGLDGKDLLAAAKEGQAENLITAYLNTKERTGGNSGKGCAEGFLVTQRNIIKGFYKFNDVILNENKFKKYSTDVQGRDRIPTRTELKRLVDLAEPRLKIGMLLSAHSGFRFKGSCNIQLKHLVELDLITLKFSSVPSAIDVPTKASNGQTFDKKGNPHITFLSSDTCEIVESYLGSRRLKGEDLSAESYLLTPVRKDISIKDKKSIVKLREISLEIYIRRHFEKYGFSERPYTLRKYFENSMLNAGVQETFIQYFSGWKMKSKMLGRYALGVEPTQDVMEGLRSEYKKGEEKLRLVESDPLRSFLDNMKQVFLVTARLKGLDDKVQWISGGYGNEEHRGTDYMIYGFETLKLKIYGTVLEKEKAKVAGFCKTLFEYNFVMDSGSKEKVGLLEVEQVEMPVPVNTVTDKNLRLEYQIAHNEGEYIELLNRGEGWDKDRDEKNGTILMKRMVKK